MPSIVHSGSTLTVTQILPRISIALSAFCGQAFRWRRLDDTHFSCIMAGKLVFVTQLSDGFSVSPCSETEVPFFVGYFNLNTDYAVIEEHMRSLPQLCPCVFYSSGIRVFTQDPFETLISFIISANNNIKRISSSVEAIARMFGTKLSEGSYAFPTPFQLSQATVSELEGAGTGYRAPYIVDTARRVYEGFPLNSLRSMDYLQAKKELLTLKGVGPKVADCVLLFSLQFNQAFPLDVWMKRITAAMFFDRQEPTAQQLKELLDSLGENAGIIQQYMFHYARNITSI